ncbi:MAG: CPBP family intramembrane metalloprotease [Eubacteriales bacterium]|nr:CPBP family intramembrane metalloprotease [Eubacteriales bacterium]
MNNYRSNKLDDIWLTVVLIHVIGSALVSFLLGIPYGLMIFDSIIWIYLAYVNRKKKAAIFLCALGWSVCLYLFQNMPISYLVAFLINVMLLSYLILLHYGDFLFLVEESGIKRPKGKELISILPLTILLLILAGYVNAISMLFFKNHITEALSNVQNQLAYAIIALALAPAVVEEIIFRGLIFHRLGNGRKAILISAMLFALGHMNYNQICYAFVMGLFFALVFRITSNLTVTILIHFLFNLFTVITTAFRETSLVRVILEFQIGGYCPFDGNLINESGTILTSAVLSGAIIMIVATILIAAILRFVIKANDLKEEEGIEKGNPGLGFYLGILACLFIAFLMK